MSPILHLAGNVLALGLGILCAMCVVRAVATFVAGDRRLFRVWLLRAVGAGAGCLGLAAMVRQAVGT